jgi:hypothetical protein
VNTRSPRAMRAAKTRLRYRDTHMRPCAHRDCPCFAAAGDTLCGPHRYAETEHAPLRTCASGVTRYIGDDRILPFDEETA